MAADPFTPRKFLCLVRLVGHESTDVTLFCQLRDWVEGRAERRPSSLNPLPAPTPHTHSARTREHTEPTLTLEPTAAPAPKHSTCARIRRQQDRQRAALADYADGGGDRWCFSVRLRVEDATGALEPLLYGAGRGRARAHSSDTLTAAGGGVASRHSLCR